MSSVKKVVSVIALMISAPIAALAGILNWLGYWVGILFKSLIGYAILVIVAVVLIPRSLDTNGWTIVLVLAIPIFLVIVLHQREASIRTDLRSQFNLALCTLDMRAKEADVMRALGYIDDIEVILGTVQAKFDEFFTANGYLPIHASGDSDDWIDKIEETLLSNDGIFAAGSHELHKKEVLVEAFALVLAVRKLDSKRNAELLSMLDALGRSTNQLSVFIDEAKSKPVTLAAVLSESFRERNSLFGRKNTDSTFLEAGITENNVRVAAIMEKVRIHGSRIEALQNAVASVSAFVDGLNGDDTAKPQS